MKIQYQVLTGPSYYRLFPMLSIFIFAVAIAGCKKFVEIPYPRTLLASATVFNDNNTANAAQTVIYSQMVNRDLFPYYLPLFTGVSSDELTSYSTFPDLTQFYQVSLTAQNGLISNIWGPTYNYIYEANAIINGLQHSTAVNEQLKKQLIGESKFIRAFWYFYLTNLFGNIPLTTTSDYLSNSGVRRASQPEVYRLIINDLLDAQSLLSDGYVAADGISPTSDRVRPNKWAATALLARVYLYVNNYDSAAYEASAVINNTSTYQLVPDLNSVFLINSPEAIWQLMSSPNIGINTVEGENFILTSPPQTNVYNCTTLSGYLLSAFEAGDQRKINWVDSIVISGTTFYFPYKYKVQFGSGITEYSTVLRLAEQYLIRAEANAQNGNLSNAVADLNAIRNRAGLPDYVGSLDKGSVLAAILHERQVELFTEWGHRWLDLKRTDNINHVLGSIKGAAWSAAKALYPIPETEIERNPFLTQNPGY